MRNVFQVLVLFATPPKHLLKPKTLTYCLKFVAMFSSYSVETYGALRGWENDMEALGLKEEAQKLQAVGHFETALPLMLRSVAMRERSHTLCLSLSELGELYLDMLKFADAEAAARRMIQEAGRYDTVQQMRIAGEIIASIAAEREAGLEHGSPVRLCGLLRRPELNGEHGVVRGMRRGPRGSDRYYVDVGASRFLLSRANFEVWMEGSLGS